MSIQNSVVAIYPTHIEADHAVKQLECGGVDMHKLSILGKGYHTACSSWKGDSLALSGSEGCLHSPLPTITTECQSG